MARKKVVGVSVPRPDRYSKKRGGTVAQSLRLSVADNRVLRQAATLKGQSINVWAVAVLVATANKTIAAHNKKTQKEVTLA